ncbi:hypothetical protein L1987_10435 [Smallanthus sonchifolius]|uniref:Uncharacterized protein n=1 Tax=Smallanthus sonchifolius TaxID=185202 RepID=A0ACB9JS13_9ASTR|nr:hypothetical protein L1987_10435 [Smallanthus sonchifolius]
MALAGINNVSVLESSYFGDNYSPVSRRWGNQEKPITRTSFIRKLWRDLEDGSKTRETERKQTCGMIDSNIGSQCSCSSEGAESEDLSIITSEAENECPLIQNKMGIQNEQEDNHNLCLQNSPAVGVADKERVRQVFREWGSKNNNGRALNALHNNNCSRARLICENESKRVRTVRQWLESNTQQAETGQSLIEEQVGVDANQTSVGARRSIRLLYGRHALLDLLTRFEMERKQEMQILLESRPVSTFAHRKRIQALLKGRFLWNQRFVQEERSTSTAERELGLLRQTNTVSDLRKGFLPKVNNHEQAHDGSQSDTSSVNGMQYQENQVLEDIVNESDTSSDNDMKNQENRLLDDIVNEYESEGQPPPPPTEIFESRDQDQDHQEEEGSVERNQGAYNIEPSQQSLELKSQYESDGDALDVDETFDHLNPSETESDILSWQEEIVEAEEDLSNTESIHSLNANSIENQDEWLYQETVHDGWYDNHHPVVTTDAFYTPDDDDDDDDDDDNNNRHELQQLMSRRRVSNLLQSDFRARLDQVLQSYLARQDQASESDEDWMLEMEHQDPYQHSIDENENDNDEAAESTEPADSWQQHPEINQHSGTEWDIINGLRMDMVTLQERMNSMQNTLETCMKMQLELQRSVQQEVSSALNRSSISGEQSMQACFLCCDSGSDSSPNRCGDVYVCSNCAQKINWSKVKESVRHP